MTSRVFGVAFACAFMLSSVAWGDSEPCEIRLAGGTEGGQYHRLAQRVAERSPCRVRVVETDGSAQNAAELGKSFDVALVQQDVLDQYLREQRLAGVDPDLVVLDRVYFEALHLLVRPPLRIGRLAEVRGMRAALGSDGSGTRTSAENLLDFFGVSTAQLQLVDVDPSDLPRAFRDGEVDVAVAVAAPGTDWLYDGLRDGAFRLLPLHLQDLRRLIQDAGDRGGRAQLHVGTVDSNTYDGVSEPTSTIAIAVLLVSTRAFAETAHAGQLVVDVRAAWRDSLDAPGAKVRALEISDRTASVTESGLPVWAFFDDSHSSRPSQWLPVLGWVSLCVALLGGAFRYRRRLLRWSGKHPVGAALAVVAALSLLATVGAYLSEHRFNDDFSTPFEAFWSITVYLFSGLEDREPFTAHGRLFSMIAVVLGPVVVAIMTGYFASSLVLRLLEDRMPNRLEDHFLIINWNSRTLRVLKELRNPLLSEHSDFAVVVVLAPDEHIDFQRMRESRKTGKGSMFEDVYFSIGDPTDPHDLANAHAHTARGVLIMAEETESGVSDTRTLQSVVGLQSIAREKGITDMSVVVELTDPSDAVILDEMAREFPGNLEYVAQGEIRTLMLAQSVMNPGLTRFYRDLMSVSNDNNEVYIRPLPPSIAGATFPEYAARVCVAHPERPMILVGIKRAIGARYELVCNPRPGTDLFTLQEGDSLLIISYEPPEAGDLPT